MSPTSQEQDPGTQQRPQLVKLPSTTSAPLLTKNLSVIAEVNTSFCEPNSDAIANYSSEEDNEDEQMEGNKRIVQADDYESTITPFLNPMKRQRYFEDSHTFAHSSTKRRSTLGYSSSVFGSEDTEFNSSTFGSTAAFVGNSYSKSKIHVLPSSPPVYPGGGDDYAEDEGENDAPLLTSSPRNDHEESEEEEGEEEEETAINFNIDEYHHIGAYYSSDPIEDTTHQKEDTTQLFNRLISEAFDTNSAKIKADGLYLRKVPETIGDLKDLVITTKDHVIKPAEIELYLGKNELKILPPRLFELENCIVLSLRQNRLKRIPDNISNLHKLKSCNFSVNEIQVLPSQILKLTHLDNFIVRPNPYLIELKDQVVSSYYQINPESPSKDQRRYISQIKWTESQSVKPAAVEHDHDYNDDNYTQIMTKDKTQLSQLSQVPKLSELCLRQIGNYAPTKREITEWKETLPVQLQLKATKALQKRVFGMKCAICDHLTIDPVAKCLEWWDFKGEKLIPIRLNFCCGGCVAKWIQGVESERNGLFNIGDLKVVQRQDMELSDDDGDSDSDWDLEEGDRTVLVEDEEDEGQMAFDEDF
ncbi:hypothetical protein WICPIJ_004379 [Wickerhamomyces pijperi]|uniref:Uncharacterized protein n=1 Tax=Wickerhamomyces pijperi TaxID=599730 RepID=A0A9P8TM43_WICPI|nr:hypothetical protein WICPIJ_004379 [Wickerhamomyces pijperi]